MQTKFLFTLICLFSLSAIFSQTTVVYTGLNTPVGLEAYGNELYIAELQSNRIVKLDITANSPSLQVVSNTNNPEGLAMQGTNLRITRTQSNILATLNVLAGTPTTAVNYFNGLNSPRAITYDATRGLYVGSAAAGLTTVIRKINGPSSSTLIATIPGNDVRGMAIIGDFLYATERNQDRIYRIDLSQVSPTPVIFKTGINMAYDIEAVGNRLYITTEAGRLYRINDVTVNNPPLNLLISGGLGALAGIEIINENIYISGWANGGRIYRYTDTTLSITDNEELEAFSVFPNPTKDLLNIQLQKPLKKVMVYDSTGKKILETQKTSFSVAHLSAGVYILKVHTTDNRIETKRFVKSSFN